jgi:hypothetical protein
MKTRIGHLLTRAELVTDAQLARALEVQSFAGGRIGTLLLERGALAEDDLGKTLALQHGCGYIPWTVLVEIPPDTLALLPARFALKHSAIPYERGEGWVKMALRDPSDLRVFDELVFVTGRKVIVGVTPEVRIYQSLEKYYGKLRAPRFALLAEKLSRLQRTASPRPAGPPPAPDFFAEMAAPTAGRESGPSLTLAPALEPSQTPPDPSPWHAPEEFSVTEWDSPQELQPWEMQTRAESWQSPSEPEPEFLESPAAAAPPPSPFGWDPSGDPEPQPALEPIPWDDTTGARSRKKAPAPVDPPGPAPAPTVAEEAAFDFGAVEPLEEEDEEFAAVAAATDRDAIADAVLEALAHQFERSAIFSSRSDGVTGWAASGEGFDAAAIRAFSATWSEPSVFMTARLSRALYLGPLPLLPRHDQLAAALGGWPGECVVQPVFIGEKPVAFLLVSVQQPGAVTVEDLDFLRELSGAASSAFANAIRLRKREI